MKWKPISEIPAEEGEYSVAGTDPYDANPKWYYDVGHWGKYNNGQIEPSWDWGYPFQPSYWAKFEPPQEAP